MITFGYKSKFSSILRACASIGVGLVMVSASDATITVVKFIAAFLFAAGIVSLAHGISKRESGSLPLMSMNALIDVVIGCLLFAFPGQVADFIPRLIGVVLVLFGAVQVIVLSGTLRLVGAGGFSMFLSLMALIGGILLVFSPFSIAIMRVLAGVFLLVYGVSELLSMSRVDKAKEAYDIKFGSQNTTDSSYTTSTSYETQSSDPGKLDTSGIYDAKEVEFTKED